MGAALQGAHPAFADTSPSGLTATDWLYGVGSLLAAVAAAAIALFGEPLLEALPGAGRRAGARGLDGLRRLHSGHVGDYVAWMTAGLATLGAVFALTLR